MAISGGDGSIILTTKVDTSGISKGSLSIRSALQGVDNTVKKVQNSFSAFREQKVTLATLNQAIKDQQYVLNSLNLEYAEYVAKGKASSTQAKELKANIDAATVEMREMQAAAATLGAKGSASINKLGIAMRSLLSYFIGIQTIFKVINFSGEAAKFATQTEASVQRLVDIYGEASQVVGDFIDQNARAIGLSRASAASFASSYGNIFSAFSDQRTNAELTNEFLNLTAVIASKTGRTLEETQEKIKSGLFGNLRAIDDLGIFVRQTALESSEAFRKLAGDRSWAELSSQEQQQIRAYAIMEQGVQKYGNTVMETTALTRSQYQAAYEDFKNTWGQVVNTVLIPVLKILTQVFTIATKGLQFMAGLSGKTIENSGETSSNIKQQTKEQEKLNKALKKGLASFDEINTLTKQNAENTADAGMGTQVSGVEELGNISGKSVEEEVSKTLERIMRIVGASLVAIGVLLIMAKKVGWGIGFIIAGASTFGVSAASSVSGAKDLGVKAVLSTIMGIVGDALLAVGVVLLFKGQIKWGIGFIIAGASAMAIEYFATTEFSTDPVENTLIQILGIAGTALAALGIILLVFGQIPWGVSLLAAGAVMLVAALALNNEAIIEAIRGPIGVITGIVGGALLVLGIILVCTGVALPLGIALIIAGATALATPISLNSNVIADWIKDVWNKVKQFWNSYIAPVFTLKWWAELAKTCGNGLISGFEAAVNSIIWLFESLINFVVSGLNLFINGLSTVTGAVGDLIGVDLTIPEIPKANLGRVSIPRLAQGAVIPPNREFMAILGDQKHGTNIEAPLDTIKQAVAEVLSQSNFGGEYGGRIEVPVIIDGREVARAVREAEGNMGSQTVFGGFANVY